MVAKDRYLIYLEAKVLQDIYYMVKKHEAL